MRKIYKKPCAAAVNMQPLSLCDLSYGGSGGGRPAQAPHNDYFENSLRMKRNKFPGEQFYYSDEEEEERIYGRWNL